MKKQITSLTKEETKHEEHGKLMNCLESAQNEIIIIMALGSFPRYIKSNDYKEWKR